VNQDIDSNID